MDWFAGLSGERCGYSCINQCPLLLTLGLKIEWSGWLSSMDGMHVALYICDSGNYHPSTPKDEF